MSRRLRLSALVLAALVLPMGGCADPVAPRALGPADLAAEYRATVPASGGAPTFGTFTLTTTENGVSTDHAARGAEVRLVLRADGTTAGRFYVPPVAVLGGEDEGIDADLTGTWTLRDSVITLAHPADTFLREMPLTVRGTDRLEGDRTFGRVRVRLVLRRQ